MVASVWFSRSILTFSLASTAWCRPSDQRRPGIRRPVNSSTMMTSRRCHPCYHVLDVAPVQRVRLDRRFDVMLQVPVLRIGDVADAEQFLDLLPAFVGDGDVLVLLVDHEVAGVDLRLARWNVDFLALFQLRDDAVHAVVLVGGLFARAADDERRTRFVDQDRIDFVDDGEVVPALHAILQIELHVVAQVVEAELVVGAVGDVGGVGFAALLVVQSRER